MTVFPLFFLFYESILLKSWNLGGTSRDEKPGIQEQ